MSAMSSTNHPTLNHHVDSLLNMSPLIDGNSNCLTHVVDTDGLFQLQAHKSPIILSHKRAILNSSLAYQTSFARVKSPQCLLTIASLFFSWNYTTESLLDYIIQRVFIHEAIPNFAVLFPQSFIILTNQSDKLLSTVMKRQYCFHGLRFLLQLNDGVNSSPRVSGALSFDNHESQSLSFSCSTIESCKNEMERTTAAFLKIVHPFWQVVGYAGNSEGGHPFRRGAGAGLTGAVASFIREPYQGSPQYKICTLNFRRSYSHVSFLLTESIKVGRTASVKFVTTVGVYTPQSSYYVYFSPFMPAVWLGILLSAGACSVVMAGSFRMQRHSMERGTLSLTALMAHWLFATGIGQYHHAGVPVVSGRCWSRNVVWIVAPVVASWFILSTLLVNVYSAIFSSDATRSFYHLTNYTDYLQLPISTVTYVLLNESYVGQLQDTSGTKSQCADISSWEPYFVCRQIIVPPACDIIRSIWYALWQDATASVTSSATEQSRRINQQLRRLNDERWKSWQINQGYQFQCANVKTLNRLLRSEEPVVFLMPDHDFQKYWQLFVQLMQSDPTIKVANNFDSDDAFLSRPVSYEFTSGLHPALKGSILTRMKILLSSGLYGLWEKWHRIKFTDGGLQHCEKKLPPVNRFDPLSFDNSGTAWVLEAQAFAWFVATLILLAERITNHLLILPVGQIMD